MSASRERNVQAREDSDKYISANSDNKNLNIECRIMHNDVNDGTGLVSLAQSHEHNGKFIGLDTSLRDNVQF